MGNGNLPSGRTCMCCGSWQGQYGLEPDFKKYVLHTKWWANEAWRVLKDNGVFFLNLGDTYSGSHKGAWKGHKYTHGKLGISSEHLPVNNFDYGNISRKCKLMIPQRIVIALIDGGWILRNDIIWLKPNAMPESCEDRFSKKFEYIFMLVKNENYFFDLDSVREKCKPLNRWGGPRVKEKAEKTERDKVTNQKFNRPGRQVQPNNGMKNPGDVWEISTKPSGIEHYATWPEELVRRMIKCSTKRDDTVLDPFCGSGMTIKVAEQLNRRGVGIDLGYREIRKKVCRNIQKEF